MGGPGVLLAVDGPSLLHRSYHAMLRSGLRTRDGRPTWAIKGTCSQLLGALDRVRPAAVVVGFDDLTRNARKERWPHYKAKRKERDADLTQQINMMIDMLTAGGVPVVQPPGLEADDVMASAAATARAAGWRCVIVTSDRDAWQLIADDVRVLRVINGGIDGSPLLTPERLPLVAGVRADQYADYAALRGDTSDELPCVARCGEKTAQALLAVFGTADAAFAEAAAGGGRIKGAKGLGPALAGRLADPAAREAFETNRAIMAMHEGIDLGLKLDQSDSPGRLPLDPAQLAVALDGLELASVRAGLLEGLCAGWTGPRPVPAPAAAPEPPSPPPSRREPPRGSAAAMFPPPIPHEAVTSGRVDPYHCMTCRSPVQPHRDSVERGHQVICTPCCDKEDALRGETRSRR